jgi:hypothetical protein
MRRTEIVQKLWLFGGEPVSRVNGSVGSIEIAVQPDVKDGKTETGCAILTFAMLDSGPVNSEC